MAPDAPGARRLDCRVNRETEPGPRARRFERYVALGDSTAEGLDDPYGFRRRDEPGAGPMGATSDDSGLLRPQTPDGFRRRDEPGAGPMGATSDDSGLLRPQTPDGFRRRDEPGAGPMGATSDGRAYRGWADRLAERVACVQGGLLYANLAVRGRTTRQVHDEQLPAALALRPDLVTLACGTNDLLRRRFDPARYAADVEAIQRPLVDGGATLLTFTLPDLGPVLPLARPLGARLRAMNDALREATARCGGVLVDVAAYPVASDPRLWSDDRLHANAAGHARIAEALAHALRLPDADASWQQPLAAGPPAGSAARLAAEVRWWRVHLLPWLWRHSRGRSSGDGRGPKRPHLAPVAVRAGADGTCDGASA